MRHLIVGCGYLGLRVAALWKNQGHEVLGTTRRSGGAPPFQSLGIEPVICDVLDPPSLKTLPAVDTVLYAIGFDRAAGQSMRAVYVDGLRNVLTHLPRPRQLIYISSSSVYGQTGGEWVDEAAATEPEEESGRIVLEAEGVLRDRMPEATVLRFAGIYGPGRLLRQKAIAAGEPISADADKWLNLIHVDDGARAVLAAQQHARPGMLVNVCDGQPVLRRDFFGALAELLHAPAPRFVPLPAGAPTPPHEKANRRLGDRRLREELGLALLYPNYLQGLAASVRLAAELE